MKKSLVILFCLVASLFVKAQSNSEKPKLMVGIVVDQMRYDYLTRFAHKYGNGGFKRMINDGFNCQNHHFNYVPTYTGPGHAAVYTGSTPKYNGIISNNWYDKLSKDGVYCVEDTTYRPVGTTHKYSRVSPHRLMSTTVTDELGKATQGRSKVIGIAIKDRAAVLPAGHSADAAYWFQGKDEGNWVTSTFYMEALPQWVQEFNKAKTVDNYWKVWDTFYDIKTYIESGDDLNPFEGGFKGKKTATFPYDLKKLKDQNGGYDLLKSTPYGNSMTTDFALAALVGEQLGQDETTDFLAISYSSPDYIGHNFGVNSKEVEDNYIRLDLEMERLLKFLDQEVGQGQYTVFLTADHGAVDVPNYLKSLHEPAGYFDDKAFEQHILTFAEKTLGDGAVIENISNFQIFLNYDKLAELGVELNDVQELLVEEIIGQKHIYKAYTAHTMQTGFFESGLEAMLQLGYNQKRSGDVLFALEPGVIDYPETGSTHGSGFSYDTHTPLLFYGKGIQKGATVERTHVTDIAPTVSALLQISFPSATIGKPLEFVLKK